MKLLTKIGLCVSGLLTFIMMSCSCSSEKSSKDTEETQTYSEEILAAVENDDFRLANKILKQEYSELPTVSIDRVYYIYGEKEQCQEKYDQYIADVKAVFRAEASKLLAMNDIEADNVLLDDLANLEIGLSVPGSGVYDNLSREYFNLYNMLAAEYNDLCLTIINKAIMKDKKYIAEKVVLLMRPTYTIYDAYGSRPECDGNHCYAEENYDQINRAKQALIN